MNKLPTLQAPSPPNRADSARRLPASTAGDADFDTANL